MNNKHLILNHFSINDFQTLVSTGKIDISEKKIEIAMIFDKETADFGDFLSGLDGCVKLVIYRPKTDLIYEVLVTISDCHKFHDGEWWMTLKKCSDVRVA